MLKDIKTIMHSYNPKLEGIIIVLIGSLNQKHGVHINFNNFRPKLGYLRLHPMCVHQLQ